MRGGRFWFTVPWDWGGLGAFCKGFGGWLFNDNYLSGDFHTGGGRNRDPRSVTPCAMSVMMNTRDHRKFGPTEDVKNGSK